MKVKPNGFNPLHTFDVSDLPHLYQPENSTIHKRKSFWDKQKDLKECKVIRNFKAEKQLKYKRKRFLSQDKDDKTRAHTYVGLPEINSPNKGQKNAPGSRLENPTLYGFKTI